MRVKLDSSAPHINPALEWRSEAKLAASLVLARSADEGFEVGVRSWAKNSPFGCERNMLCCFQRGSGRFEGDNGESIECVPGTTVHFKSGWRGRVEIAETLEAAYAISDGGSSAKTPVLRDVMNAGPLKDWGVISTMIEGKSVTAGILLSREENGRTESGVWTCTPGTWNCEVTNDEFCHFIEGSCSYTHESGERIEVEPDTLAYFPKGWRGTCEVRRTVRKVYMIR